MLACPSCGAQTSLMGDGPETLKHDPSCGLNRPLTLQDLSGNRTSDEELKGETTIALEKIQPLAVPIVFLMEQLEREKIELHNDEVNRDRLQSSLRDVERSVAFRRLRIRQLEEGIKLFQSIQKITRGELKPEDIYGRTQPTVRRRPRKTRKKTSRSGDVPSLREGHQDYGVQRDGGVQHAVSEGSKQWSDIRNGDSILTGDGNWLVFLCHMSCKVEETNIHARRCGWVGATSGIPESADATEPASN